MARAAAVALAGSLLLLAGCGGQDPAASPTSSATSSTGTTASTSPTPTPPTMPAAAQANTKAGAIAFVRHYIALINYAQATGDVAVLAAVEDPSCTSCLKVRRTITRIYGAGGSISGGTWHPDVKSAHHNADGTWLVSGIVTFDPEKCPAGSWRLSEVRAQEGRQLTHLSVSQLEGAWRVMTWSREMLVAATLIALIGTARLLLRVRQRAIANVQRRASSAGNVVFAGVEVRIARVDVADRRRQCLRAVLHRIPD